MGVVDGGARLGTLVTLTDVTDEERGRRRLLQAEKMSFVGQTLASVAHELNNPLAAIVAYADLLAEASVPPNVGQLLERIREQATRTSRIVKNLLNVARRRGPERTRSSLNEIATSVVELFAYDARLSNVLIQPILDPDLPPLLVDRHSIQQIIVNLVQNALHSLRSRKQAGTVEIGTSWSGSVARLVVRDDGPGVPAEARGRLFEAFFTTKGPDEGTGLGLAISRGIAREHGGDLTLEDRGDGRPGAQFSLRLPLAEREAAPTEAPAQVPEGVPANILVVDDEAAVRDSLVAHARPPRGERRRGAGHRRGLRVPRQDRVRRAARGRAPARTQRHRDPPGPGPGAVAPRRADRVHDRRPRQRRRRAGRARDRGAPSSRSRSRARSLGPCSPPRGLAERRATRGS